MCAPRRSFDSCIEPSMAGTNCGHMGRAIQLPREEFPHKQTPNRSLTDPKSTPNRSQIDPKPTRNRPQIFPKPAPNRPQTDHKSTPNKGPPRGSVLGRFGARARSTAHRGHPTSTRAVDCETVRRPAASRASGKCSRSCTGVTECSIHR